MKTSWVYSKILEFFSSILVRVILLSSWVIQEPGLYQRTFPSFECCLHWKEWFLPSTFHIHLLFFHPIFRKKTQFCPDLSRGHNSHSTHPKLVILRPKLKFRSEISRCFGITSIGVLYHKISTILNYYPNWNFSNFHVCWKFHID